MHTVGLLLSEILSVIFTFAVSRPTDIDANYCKPMAADV
jgi:hypothetical protein